MNTIKGISATNIGCGKVENVVDSTLTTKEQMHIGQLHHHK